MAHSFTISVQIHNTTIATFQISFFFFSSTVVSFTHSVSFCRYPSPRGDPLVMLSSKWSHLTRRLWWPRSAIKRPWRTDTWRCSSAPQRRWALCWWEEPWTAVASPLHPASFHVSEVQHLSWIMFILYPFFFFFHLLEHGSTKKYCLEGEGRPVWTEHLLFFKHFSDSVRHLLPVFI